MKVKNMVCDRCKHVLESELTNSGFEVEKIDLGEIQIANVPDGAVHDIREILVRNGFELIESDKEELISSIKNLMLKALSEGSHNQNLSDYLSDGMNKEYSVLSKIFSAGEGITIEKYYIRIKIEKAKELIQMKKLNFSEIAYHLNYNSSSHLAKQFKAVTGMSMSDYQKAKEWNRKPLDQII